jgi:hypothetical protein
LKSYELLEESYYFALSYFYVSRLCFALLLERDTASDCI